MGASQSTDNSPQISGPIQYGPQTQQQMEQAQQSSYQDFYNGFSTPDSLVVPDRQCSGLSNDHISYITKQYVTLIKAQSILQEVKTKLLKTSPIQDPSDYLIDTSQVLYDLYAGYTNTTTFTIFNPIPKVVGIHNGIPITKLYTCLDDYNDFFSIEYGVLTLDSDKNARVDVISDKIQMAISNCIDILTSSCNEIGKVIRETKLPQNIDPQADIDSKIQAVKDHPEYLQQLLDYTNTYAPQLNNYVKSQFA